MKIAGIHNIKFFAKGRRGFVYTGSYKGRKVAIKVKNPQSKAIKRIRNEAKYLQLVNSVKIGPKFVMFKDNKLIYEFVEGKFIVDYVKNNNKDNIKKVIKKIFNQMFILDKLGINKEEMHKPVKHIIVTNNKPVLIDFERAYKTEKPHNVTQFCQFLIGKNVKEILKEKNIKINKKRIINNAKNYKKERNKGNLQQILKSLL